MTTYTAIPDANLEPDAPARSVDAILLRDNPIAISEGAAGAPKIDPINAMAHGGLVGEIGTYAFLIPSSSRNTDYSAGSTLAGSSLRYAGIGLAGPGSGPVDGATYTDVSLGFLGTPPGTWRCMGRSNNNASGTYRLNATLWLRIS